MERKAKEASAYLRENRTWPETWPVNAYLEEALRHRSIRKFTAEAVDSETVEMLSTLASYSANSTGMQQASFIRVTDKELAKEIARVCKQDYVAEAPELWIFLVDLYRNAKIAERLAVDTPEIDSMNRFFSGFRDANIMAQSVYSGLESLGLGGVFLGSVSNDPGKIIELLDLPRLTFPAIGLAFGHIDQDPQVKPRMPLSMKRFENRYALPEDFFEQVDRYDEEIRKYYDLRKENQREESFSKQVEMKYGQLNHMRSLILQDIAKQGFCLRAEETEEKKEQA